MHGLDKVANVLHVAGPASVHSFGRPAFPAVDGRYLAPGPASLGCTGQAQRLRHWTAGFPRSRRLSRPAHSAADGGGRRRFGRRGFDFCRYLCFSARALGFVGRP